MCDQRIWVSCGEVHGTFLFEVTSANAKMANQTANAITPLSL
jgi:hypothetical protein